MNLPPVPEFPNHPLARVGLLLVYVVMSTYGLYQLKSADFASLMFIIGFGFYGMGFLLWMLMLKSFPLSVIFPTAAGGLIVATQLTGHLFLNESLRPTQWAGVALVLVALGLLYWPEPTA